MFLLEARGGVPGLNACKAWKDPPSRHLAADRTMSGLRIYDHGDPLQSLHHQCLFSYSGREFKHSGSQDTEYFGSVSLDPEDVEQSLTLIEKRRVLFSSKPCLNSSSSHFPGWGNVTLTVANRLMLPPGVCWDSNLRQPNQKWNERICIYLFFFYCFCNSSDKITIKANNDSDHQEVLLFRPVNLRIPGHWIRNISEGVSLDVEQSLTLVKKRSPCFLQILSK